eukprot:5673107-Pyramimonas_sp.AAC.1
MLATVQIAQAAQPAERVLFVLGSDLVDENLPAGATKPSSYRDAVSTSSTARKPSSYRDAVSTWGDA